MIANDRHVGGFGNDTTFMVNPGDATRIMKITTGFFATIRYNVQDAGRVDTVLTNVGQGVEDRQVYDRQPITTAGDSA